MTRDEYLARKAAGEPIGSARELVFALMELQRERTHVGEPVWYLLNRLQRQVMDQADREGT